MKHVTCGVLSNGMRVYSKYDNISFVSGIGVRAGSIYDPSDCRGMAHLAEHVVARRTAATDGRSVDLLFREYMGGPDDDINIRMDRISTFFGHDDLLRRDHMLAVFDVMARMVRERLIDQEGLEVEQAAVHQEYCLRGKDALEDELDVLVHQNLYTKNPARNRMDCERDELRAISREKLIQFVRRYYVPKNMFVLMIGPPHAEVMEYAHQYFDGMDETTTPRLDYDRSDDLPILSTSREVAVVRPGAHQHHVAVAWPTVSASHKDAEALDILADLLSLRLAWRLREANREFDGGVYRVPVDTERSFCHGLLWARFATTSADFARRGRDAILAEAADLRNQMVPADEFDAVRNRRDYIYRHAFTYGSGALSEMIIESACNGDVTMDRLNTYQDRLKKVNRRYLRDVAKHYLTPEHLAVLISPA